MELTHKDEHMIMLLRENGRLSVSELARQLSVSRTAAQMRLQKLERKGVIEGFSVKLSEDHTKKMVRALVMIKFPPGKLIEIQQSLSDILQITTIYSISGPYDLAVVITAPSMQVLDTVIDKIGCLKGIDDTVSSIILSTKLDR